MRSVLLLLLSICFVENSLAQSAAINIDGSNADASAILDVKSTNKGFLLPRMTTVQRTAIVMPALGLKVFDTDTKSFWFYNGTAWVSLYSGVPANYWTQNGDNIRNNNPGNIGIGADANSYKLSVVHNTGTGGIYLKNTAGTTTINMEATGTTADTRIWMSRDNQIRWIIENDGSDNSFQIRQNGFLPNIMIEAGTGNIGIGVANPSSKLDVEGNAEVSGRLTVNNGKGVAYNENSSTNLRIYQFTTGSFNAALAGHAISGEAEVIFNGGFVTNPRVFVGDIDVTGGTSGQLYMVQLQLYGCTTTGGVTTCKARLINNSASSISYSITWNCLAIGY